MVNAGRSECRNAGTPERQNAGTPSVGSRKLKHFVIRSECRNQFCLFSCVNCVRTVLWTSPRPTHRVNDGIFELIFVDDKSLGKTTAYHFFFRAFETETSEWMSENMIEPLFEPGILSTDKLVFRKAEQILKM